MKWYDDQKNMKGFNSIKLTSNVSQKGMYNKWGIKNDIKVNE